MTTLAEHLASEVGKKTREDDFDMNDGPELPLLETAPDLHDALQWLAGPLEEPWRQANTQAKESQRHHRLLARIAIVAGTAAIELAIVQLATRSLYPKFEYPKFVEAVAVACAVIAVSIGLIAKYNRKWLGERHLAERLRMLKFRALEQLWCMDNASWQQWVEEQLRALRNADGYSLAEAWREADEVEIPDPEPVHASRNAAFVTALTSYYLSKRIRFQANYFASGHKKYEKQTGIWLRLALPLFLAGVLCVIVHFLSEWWHLSAVATWFVAFAAIIPVFSAGLRAWFAAFEVPRSASLFAAKNRALIRAADNLARDAGKVAETQWHMALTEYFLENEHREWLRLLRDTEWFL